MITKTNSKTFRKGVDFHEILDFITSEKGGIETNDYTPEGTAGYGDGLSPHDPVSELKFKYVISITKVFDKKKD